MYICVINFKQETIPVNEYAIHHKMEVLQFVCIHRFELVSFYGRCMPKLLEKEEEIYTYICMQ